MPYARYISISALILLTVAGCVSQGPPERKPSRESVAIPHESSARDDTRAGSIEQGALEQTGRIFAGLGSAEITPTKEMIESYGWGEVLAPLHVKVLILKGETASIAWVTYDALAIPSPGRFRETVAEATGVPPERVIVAATHTHGDAPQHVYEVTALMMKKTREAAMQAAQGIFPARIGDRTGNCRRT